MGRVSTKHRAVFVELYQRFVKARNLGRKVSYTCFYINANSWIQMHQVCRRVLPCASLGNKTSNWGEYNNNNKKKKQGQKGNFEDKLKQWYSFMRGKTYTPLPCLHFSPWIDACTKVGWQKRKHNFKTRNTSKVTCCQ